MSRIGPLPPDDSWRYAIIGGFASLPWTASFYWQSANRLSLGPILFGGVVAGYLCDANHRRVGARAGVVGALPALWLLVDLFAAVTGAAGPAWFRVTAVGLGLGAALAVAAFAFGLAAALGVVGATFGDWLSTKAGRDRPPVTGE
ncbi:DUF5518 domain-containing protein [Salinirarus marinus]|uniref:DUF5518 domain-containing protein n=1 Tax=Salinirarus marinus TaxID=3068310 RepID=UPI003C6C42B6